MGMSAGMSEQLWPAPVATEPVQATVAIPGSKSITNRALILAALADAPSTITGGLVSRDTELMMAALRAMGTQILLKNDQMYVTPAEKLHGGQVDCGLAGTVMLSLIHI